VIGFLPQDKDEYIQKAANIFTRFLALPDEEKVMIVLEEPDMLCGACKVGLHCSRKPAEDEYSDGDIQELFLGNIQNHMELPAGELKKVLLTNYSAILTLEGFD
jgi:hypothetical protein